MKRQGTYALIVTVSLGAFSVQASWTDTISQSAEQFLAGFEDSARQEIERRSGTILNRARRFANSWLPGNRNINDETGFVLAGRGIGHVIGYVGAWLAAVDQRTDAEQFRTMILRGSGTLLGFYILYKFIKSDDKKVVNIKA